MEMNMLFEGAVREQLRQHVSVGEAKVWERPSEKKEIVVERDGKAFTLTFSDEMKQLKAMTAEEIAQMDLRSIEADSSDIFSYRPQDQWLIFSQYLHDNGQYEGKNTKEIEQLENLLVDITDGLDNLHIASQKGRDIKSGSKPITQQLTSAEAQLELASSTAVLQRFSEKFVPGDAKAGFDALIEQYTKRNKEHVLNYTSIDEKFYKGRAKIFEARGMDTSTLNAEQKKTLSVTNKLGKTNFVKAEISEMIEGYKEKFSRLQRHSDLEALLVQLQEKLTKFVTKDISDKDNDYEAATEFVNEKTAKTFERIAGYWGKLFV